MNKRAVILAGGKGTRLRPYTAVLPKPLMPVGDYPILEIIIRQLLKHGFDHITLAVNHQSDLFKAFFGDGSKWNVRIDYSLEQIPLSTMGPLKLIKNLPENFLVMNGDVLTDLNFTTFYETHVASQNLFTISAFQREEKIEYGVLEIDNEMLTGFSEKPNYSFNVSMGIYMANREVLNLIPENEKYGFDNLMLDMIKANTPASVRIYNGYWLDIGRPDDYTEAIEKFDSLKEALIGQ
ncbi:MAG: NTP transferase domain-containing protein [Bacteroidia bacterium]|nr:NTP transferase domain-containing protein [Bacteroidia bacterium]